VTDAQPHPEDLYSFLSLPDTTNLPFHLNGTWAQGSDRGRLLMESDDSPNIDRQKLNWNRHILFDFLPKLYCYLIKKAVQLNVPSDNIHPISKFWPFPYIYQNYPKYAIEYGFKVLELLLQNEEILISNNNESDRVKILFELLSYNHIIGLRNLLRNNWDDLRIRFNPSLKTLVRSLPIWESLSNPVRSLSIPFDTDSNRKLLKPASCGYILKEYISHCRIKTSKIYLNAYDDINSKILNELDVPERTTFEYTFEDVDFPKEYDTGYLHFLKDILNYNQIVQNLKDKRRFPNSITKKLKKISDLYDNNNLVFRTVFGVDSSVFLHPEFSEYTRILSKIGFRNNIDQDIFKTCAVKVKELQRDPEPPSDIRYRGFILVDHLYKHINSLNLESIEGIPFIPITKALQPTLQKSSNVIPPQQVLEKYPSFGKPGVSTVVRHLRFLYSILRNDDVWRKDWADTFKNNIYEVYKWLDEECGSNEDIDLLEHICSEPLFLNFIRNQDPFNIENWVTADDLVLNSELGDVKYVNQNLAKYPTMLKSAGAREITRQNIIINVRKHDQSHHSKSTLFKFLFDPISSLNDVTFVVNGENIKASRYMLAAGSEFFHQIFTSAESSPNTAPFMFTIKDIHLNSMCILLRYIYGQNIDEAIQNQQNLNENYHQDPNLTMYKDLLKLANDYMLDYLKELMELRLSRLVLMSNVKEMKTFAENSSANQLCEYCNKFIRDNSEM
ncbi:13276_t:CDS:2, partial [Funneliformis geosporum]